MTLYTDNDKKTQKYKLLIVHHGFPPEFEAGSEVYTFNLAHHLKNIFNTRLFYRTQKEIPENMITKNINGLVHYIVREPDELTFKRLHEQESVDRAFQDIINRFQPNFVYFGHLNHLSLNLISIAKSSGAKIVFTLHDFWLLCPRGQFIGRDLKICEPVDEKRCINCLQHKYTKNGKMRSESNCLDLLENRKRIIQEIFDQVDFFIAPSKFLRNYFIKEGLDPQKCVYRDYGFNLDYFKDFSNILRQQRKNSREIVFGYCGTAIPSKGVEILIQAFEILQKMISDAQKSGKFPKSNNSSNIKLEIHASRHFHFGELYEKIQSTSSKNPHIELFGKYPNQNVAQIFASFDVLVVPSIWYENSPLVIHEAFQAGIPIITSNKGGMKELVQDQKNGLLFEQGNPEDLAQKMFFLIQDPQRMENLGKNHPEIHSIQSDAEFIHHFFLNLLNQDKFSNITLNSACANGGIGPWRITFDTNPDDCNLSCIMCEGFSRFNPNSHRLQARNSKPRRMPFSLLEKVVWNALPFGLKEIIPSTMGEPLLYSDFEKILELCNETGIFLNLTTNGTFPRKRASDWAEMIIPVASDAKISWNSLIPEVQEQIMVGSPFAKRMEDLKKFVDVRNRIHRELGHYCQITLQMTFMEKNYRELPSIIKFASELGVDRIKGHHLWVLYTEMEEQSLLRNKESISRWNEIVRKSQEILESLEDPSKPKLDNILIFQEFDEKNIPVDWECPFLAREAWIAWNGDFNICCAPDEQRRTLGTWGNVKSSDFMKLWLTPSLKKLRQTYKEHPICRSCLLRRPIQQNYKKVGEIPKYKGLVGEN